jgi:hypothetical protein
MTSKVIADSEERKQAIQDFLPDVVAGKTKPSGQGTVDTKEQLKDFLRAEDVSGESNVTGKGSKKTVDSIDTKDTGITKIPEATVHTEPEEPVVSTVAKRVSGKQRKESLEEYRETFLTVPKIEDRKPVFVSCDSRDRLDEIARRLGGRGMSVSGLIENLVRHHLEIYREDLDGWKKL